MDMYLWIGMDRCLWIGIDRYLWIGMDRYLWQGMDRCLWVGTDRYIWLGIYRYILTSMDRYLWIGMDRYLWIGMDWYIWIGMDRYLWMGMDRYLLLKHVKQWQMLAIFFCRWFWQRLLQIVTCGGPCRQTAKIFFHLNPVRLCVPLDLLIPYGFGTLYTPPVISIAYSLCPPPSGPSVSVCFRFLRRSRRRVGLGGWGLVQI